MTNVAENARQSRLCLSRLRFLPPAVIVKLVCRDCVAAPREISIDQFPAELGRGLDVAVRIDDRWASRRHCKLEMEGGVVIVRDLGSTHGTFVNGRSVSESKLLPGDELRVGTWRFVAEYEVPAEAAQRLSALA